MKLSDKIVGLRKSNGMSQEDLAEKLDVSRQAISRWESGAAMPDANNILQLSKLFDVTTDSHTTILTVMWFFFNRKLQVRIIHSVLA